MMKRLCLALLAVMLTGAVAAQAAGPRPDTDAENRDAREVAKAAQWIEEGKYGRSIRVLNDVVERDPGNADAYNLLGYVHRKMGNLDDAQYYYEHALAIDPNHRGALEYQGELYLMQDKPDQARENLERLEAACPEGCEERDQLAEAIANYENGVKPEAGGQY